MRTHLFSPPSTLIRSLTLLCFLGLPGFAQTPPPSPEAQPESSEGQVDAGSAPREETAETAYVRVQRDDRGRPLSLDTAIVRYVPAGQAGEQDGDQQAGVVVDLIGAVHVGEASYYEQLNELFTKYDALLFELVAPEGIQFREGDRLESASAVGALQGGLKNLLGLEFQLELVNYARPNFVHADMTPEEFAQTMKDRGESFFSLLLRLMGQGMALQGQQKAGGATDIQVMMALLRRDRVKLKQVLAEQLEGMEGSLSVLGGPDGESTIISERNKKALDVLRREMESGKKKIGIFYGAGHFADFDGRLKDDFQLEIKEKNWLPAWDLQKDHSQRNRRP